MSSEIQKEWDVLKGEVYDGRVCFYLGVLASLRWLGEGKLTGMASGLLEEIETALEVGEKRDEGPNK